MNLTPRPDSYLEITILVPATEIEAAQGALLACGAMGTATEEPPCAPARVQGFFPADADISREEILASFQSLAVTDRTPEVHVRRAPWRDWAGESQAAFRRFAATEDLMIAPPWDPIPDERVTHLTIHPGAAFGIGSHPTTRGCLDLIPRPGDAVPRGTALDVGTGTGILALRARQCGYGPVIGFDNDPIAIEAAAANAHLNEGNDPLHLFVGEAAALGSQLACALIIANLFLNPLTALAAELIAHLQEDGVMILSGIRENDATELLGVYAEAGAVLEERRGIDGWAALRLRIR